jgi:predicted HicB family RNase H-like nuclease
MSEYLGERVVLTLRIPTTLKRKIDRIAEKRGVSFNQLCCQILRENAP